jgi:hypothetical protein
MLRTPPLAALAPAALALALLLPAAASAQAENMSFFITSHGPGEGADLGGIEGADAWCEHLAYAVGHGDKEWRAYLSTTGPGGENARDRIGTGPWYNYEGILIARDVTNLHSEDVNINAETVLTARGAPIKGRGETPNTHDILTGSTLDGRALDTDGDTTCDNWTTSSSDGSAQVGHHDRTGGGQNPESWNSAHGSRGCSQEDLRGTGGDGYFYCFAADAGGMDDSDAALLLRRD